MSNYPHWGGAGVTQPLFDWIRQHLPDGKHILELGSGEVSTNYLSRFYRMTSVENDPAYWDKFSTRYIKAPLVDGWYDLAILEAELPKDYDLLLVDGPVGSGPRAGFMKNLRLFRTDVPIIIDDTWRDVELRMANELATRLGAKLEVFSGGHGWAVLVPNPPDCSAQSGPVAEAQNPTP
jgi:hypothetical protein